MEEPEGRVNCAEPGGAGAQAGAGGLAHLAGARVLLQVLDRERRGA
jgi:hypothetical protein